MKTIKIFKSEYDLDINLFEMVFTLTCAIGVGVAGVFRQPAFLPVARFNFVAIAVLLGFVVGFVLSSLITWAYKKLLKRK